MNLLVFLTAGTEGSGGMAQILVLYAAIFAIFWFFLIRPQKKKQKAIQTMQDSISVGDSVLTSGGLYGKVIDKVNDVYMVEFGTNKSVRVPVQKSAIVSITEPDLTITKEIEEVKDTKETKEKETKEKETKEKETKEKETKE
jgi:preprotein translocase subunit YajC